MSVNKFVLKFIMIFAMVLSFGVYAQTVKTYSTSGTYYWTAPYDVSSVQIECWGAGGSGGGATANPSAGGGGSGGAYTKHATFTVVPGQTYTIQVGAGGTASTGDGVAGGDSWFGSSVSLKAVGGAGGLASSTTSYTATGASAITSGNIGGTINYYGGAGGTGVASGVSSGGGGGSAGSAANGNSASGVTGGAAVTDGGAGGDGQTATSNGNAGASPGAGGAGGRTGTGANKSGGAGGDGKVMLTYTTISIMWIGAGVSGGTGGTDFNTASNWSPAQVPGSTDNAYITTTTAATITLSANATVGSLTILNDATGNVVLILDVQTNVLTVNGGFNTNINAGGGTNTTLSLRVGNSPGAYVLNGSAIFGNNSNTSSKIGFTGSAAGTTTGTVMFKGDVYFGAVYTLLTGNISKYIWDASSSQTIYTNANNNVYLNGTCQIGSTNSPTVTLSGTTSTSMYVSGLAGVGDLTVKTGSTLDLGGKFWNKATTGGSAAGGVFTLESGSTLKLAGTTGGQAGSNFPLNFTTSNPVIDISSIVEYNGTGNQTIYDVASPGYGKLVLTNNSIKRATSGLDVRGDFTNNTTSTFNGGTSLSHVFKGNWINDGSFTYTTTSSITFSGTSNQSIGGVATTSFYDLYNSNTSTGLTLNTGIQVVNVLNMSGATANINLNGNNIDLLSTGSISGESNTDRIYGSTGLITTTRNLSNIVALDVAGLGCLLTTTANMGSTTISRGHSAQYGSGLVNSTIERYYSISPTNNSGLNATMQFNYFDNELNGLSANESGFELYRSTDGGSTWTERFGAVVPASNNVTLSLIDAFSLWTVSFPDPIVLPIELIVFDVKKENENNIVYWKTITETNNDFFTLERSEDGKNFESITTINGAGNSSDEIDYRYVDANYSNNVNYYRLMQTDYDGAVRVSSIVSVDNTKTSKMISKIINIHGQEVDEHYSGVVIIVYKDGSVLRTTQKPLNY